MTAYARVFALGLLALTSLGVLAGCATANGRSQFSASVEPLSEAEFDEFALDIAEQLVARMERDELALPLTIAPPNIERGDVSSGAARAFAQRLGEAVSDRLGGEVRFGAGSGLRSRLAFGPSRWSDERREARFTILDSMTNSELIQSVCEYDAVDAPQYAGLRSRLREDGDRDPAPAPPSAAPKPAPSGAQFVARSDTSRPNDSDHTGTARRHAVAPRSNAHAGSSPAPALQSPTVRNARLAERLARLKADASHLERVSAPLLDDYQRVAEGVASLIKRSPALYVEEGRGAMLFHDEATRERLWITTRITPAGDPLRPTIRLRGQSATRMRCRVVYYDETSRAVGATATFELAATPYAYQRAELPTAPAQATRFVVVVDSL